MGCACATAASAQAPGAPPSADVISKKVAQAKTTRVLALRECGLKQLPPSAVAAELCAVLRTADLMGNSLKALPEVIGACSSLQNLNCGKNKLTELPATIGQLASLQKFVLSDNQLGKLPVELSQLGKLKLLQLDGNRLVSAISFPMDVFGGALSDALEELDLSGNDLEELPTCVANLRVLQRLNISKNRLTSLPGELQRLSNLQKLDASDNRLSSLPQDMLPGMTSLSELWLKGNPMQRLQLQELPGFDKFLDRRRERLDAKIDANVVGRVDLAVCGLD
mmetsp:Transcript_58440/g.163713  ORF Transcript_58440/g.163713 Transcript_58440/m.163713 type:complete len:280 (+) Transcript_58440:61-900(+)